MLRYSGVPKEHPDVNDMTTSASIESSMERSHKENINMVRKRMQHCQMQKKRKLSKLPPVM